MVYLRRCSSLVLYFQSHPLESHHRPPFPPSRFTFSLKCLSFFYDPPPPSHPVVASGENKTTLRLISGLGSSPNKVVYWKFTVHSAQNIRLNLPSHFHIPTLLTPKRRTYVPTSETFSADIFIFIFKLVDGNLRPFLHRALFLGGVGWWHRNEQSHPNLIPNLSRISQYRVNLPSNLYENFKFSPWLGR